MEFWTTVLCFCVAIFFISRIKSKKTKLPPGPKPLPVIGNLLDLGEKPHKSLAGMAKVHGPIMSLKLGQVTTVVVSSSAMAKEVLQTNDQFLCDRVIPDSLTAHNHHEVGFPWISVSPLWRNYRKICNNTLFAGKILDANENLRRKKVEELVEIVRRIASNGEAVDLGSLLFTTTVNLLSNTVFSVDLADLSSELARDFKNHVRGVMEEAGKPNLSDYFQIMRKIDIQGMRRRMKIHMKNVLNLMDKMMNQRIQQQKLNPDSVPNTDMLHYLLKNDEIDAKIDQNQTKHLLFVRILLKSRPILKSITNHTSLIHCPNSKNHTINSNLIINKFPSLPAFNFTKISTKFQTPHPKIPSMATVASAAAVIPSFTGLKSSAAATKPAAHRLTVRASLKDLGVAVAATAASAVLAANALAMEVKLGSDDGNLVFDPSEFTVSAGDTITFKNNAGFPHNVVFDEDEIPSGVDASKISMNEEDLLNAAGEVYEVKLTAKGTYSFYCAPHQGAGMVGKVTVN